MTTVGDPVLHVLAGPNGAGKSTLYDLIVGPETALPMVNADVIAAERWPNDPSGHAYQAAAVAAEQRDRLIGARRSFVAETVFSHGSKVELIERARTSGYLVTLHVLAIPEDLAVARVNSRVGHGGHDVPEDKIRSRHRRLWGHVAAAVTLVDSARVYDNSKAAEPFRHVASYVTGRLVSGPAWPTWVPDDLRHAGQ